MFWVIHLENLKNGVKIFDSVADMQVPAEILFINIYGTFSQRPAVLNPGRYLQQGPVGFYRHALDIGIAPEHILKSRVHRLFSPETIAVQQPIEKAFNERPYVVCPSFCLPFVLSELDRIWVHHRADRPECMKISVISVMSGRSMGLLRRKLRIRRIQHRIW
jgi:hypothetical protein